MVAVHGPDGERVAKPALNRHQVGGSLVHIATKAGAVLAGAIVASGALAGVASAKSTTVPAQTVTFQSGDCTATFVRSASGIVNETNRDCPGLGSQNPWVGADVYLQFRPVDGTPNPACDPDGLVTDYNQDWTNHDPALVDYFGANHYNVCVYLVNPQVASGTIEANAPGGATATLPSKLAGHYRIDVVGTYANDSKNVADAEYVSLDNWTTYVNGYDVAPYDLGEGFGDVQVDQQFVNWGAYSPAHQYSYDLATTAPSINLRVFDGDSNGPGASVPVPSWYEDNTGSLSYTITYLGQ